MSQTSGFLPSEQVAIREGTQAVDPRAVFARVEERVQTHTTPAHLRRMAESARREARVLEDRAAARHGWADYYEDLAREREQG